MRHYILVRQTSFYFLYLSIEGRVKRWAKWSLDLLMWVPNLFQLIYLKMFSNVSCCPIIILLLSNFAHGSRRRHTSQIEINGKQTAVWTRLLRLASNGTGEVSRDLVLETLIEKIFTHLVKPKISNGEELLGSRLDPFWLFPIGECENIIIDRLWF